MEYNLGKHSTKLDWLASGLYLVREDNGVWQLYYQEYYDESYFCKVESLGDYVYFKNSNSIKYNDYRVKGKIKHFIKKYQHTLSLNFNEVDYLLKKLSMPNVQCALESAYQNQLKKQIEQQKVKDKYQSIHEQENAELKNIEDKYKDTIIEL